MLHYHDELAPPQNNDTDDNPLIAAGLEPAPDEDDEPADVSQSDVDQAIAELPVVTIRHEAIPDNLSAARFLQHMVNRVLDTTPVNFHKEARSRKTTATRL